MTKRSPIPTPHTAPATDLSQLLLEANGNLLKLTPIQRFEYYRSFCAAGGLDWQFRPFDYLQDEIRDEKGKVIETRLTLYPNIQAAEQLARLHQISVRVQSRQFVQNLVYEVVSVASTPDGRSCDASGVVSICDAQDNPYRGKALASAMKSAETSAFRRAVLRLAGFTGWIDGESATATLLKAETFDPPVDVAIAS